MHSAHFTRHTLRSEALMSQSESLHLTPGLGCPDFNPEWRFLQCEKASGFISPTPERLPGADGERGRGKAGRPPTSPAGLPDRLDGGGPKSSSVEASFVQQGQSAEDSVACRGLNLPGYVCANLPVKAFPMPPSRFSVVGGDLGSGEAKTRQPQACSGGTSVSRLWGGGQHPSHPTFSKGPSERPLEVL